MWSGKRTGSVLLGAAAMFACSAARGQVLYSQNFDSPVPLSSQSVAFGGFGQINNISGTGWQVQGGGGGGGIAVTTGVDTNGVGGSQALFVLPDHSTASSFTFNQYTIYGAVGAPGAGVTPSQIQIDMDLFISGSETSNTPVDVLIQNTADMSFTPTLTNGQYTHVSYLLSAATNAGSYNPLASSNVRLQHGAGGFGFDNNNLVRVDNIVIQVVPEPGSMSLALAGAGAVLVRRRRAAVA